MESLLKKELGSTVVRSFGSGAGGCISKGQGYTTDQGRVYAKNNAESGARRMFDGEAASLEAIMGTQAIAVPKPIKVFDNPSGGSVLVMEYIDMKGLSRYNSELGTKIARMHLHNQELNHKLQKQQGSAEQHGSVHYVAKFGFHVTTCCGYIAQDNSWEEDWVKFFTKKKLQLQLDLIEKEYKDSELRTLWGKLLPNIPKLFEGIEIIPALLHGDLWGGNAAETNDGPVIFDAASFYGHHEFDLAIASMFGGFSASFFDAYHQLIPKSSGFQQRHKLYKLFHYLNHWNHFGTGYRSQSVGLMKELVSLRL